MTSVILTDLPLELLEMIANRICNSQGYLSFRLSCKKCYFSTRSIKKYFKDGELSEYLPLRGGVPHGKSYCYFLNGNISMEKTFIKGIQQEEEKLYYFSKRILFRGKVINGKKEGRHFWYNLNGTISKTTEFKNGKRNGKCISYDSSGDRLSMVKFVNNLEHGPFECFLNDIPHIYIRFDNGKINGLVSIVSIFHTLAFVGQVSDDILHGTQTFFNSDGEIRLILPFFNGRINGIVRRYYTNGKLLSIVKFKNNFKQGAEKIFWDNGKLRCIKNWEDNKKNGPCKLYFKNGILKQKCYFRNNKMDGPCIKYDEKSNKETVTNYSNGQLKDFIIYFHQNSEIINDINFFYENKSHSNFISYYKNMDPRSIKYDTGDFVYSFLKLIRPNGDIIKKINIKINGVLMKDYIKNERIINRYIQYGEDPSPTPYLYL